MFLTDLFCSVVDNYGDIGVCWRLARQLAHERGFRIRLWVDDLASFARLCPAVDPARATQSVEGVEVCHWPVSFPPNVSPADVVIEAFACELPASYLEAMAVAPRKPVWVNLEYLSAEPWVEGCHGMRSPHPRVPLTKHFFFPGFTPATGGLLRERDLLTRRESVDASARAAFWREFGYAPPEPGATSVSLFAYPSAPWQALFKAWMAAPRAIVCAIPAGALQEQVASLFGQGALEVGAEYGIGQLRVRPLPFLPQPRFDEILWSCDVNFVRGEDSFVRAQWAARPFVWQIYPQADEAHVAKLRAFEARYLDGLAPAPAEAVRRLWAAWNGVAGDAGAAWADFEAARAQIAELAGGWAERQGALPGLADRLADFIRDRLE